MTVPGDLHARRLARLRGLYAIVGDDAPVERAEAAIAGGAAVVQLRMKRAPAGEILEVARRIVAAAAARAAAPDARPLVLVNDRPDLALLAGADGVHVGDEDLPPAEVRRLLGPDLLVGRTTRNADAARAALAEGADHVGYGPVFDSATKPLEGVARRGLDGLAAACAAVHAPVVAISGITLANVAEVARAGAACAAVAGDLLAGGAGAADVTARAAALVAEFARGRRGRE